MNKTYELRITIDLESEAARHDIHTLKEHLKDFLIGIGEESFVEGAVDNLYQDYDHERPDHENYDKLGGEGSPISLYHYDKAHLQRVCDELEHTFEFVRMEFHEMETQDWQEGWKQGFKPFATERFFVYPPWERAQVPTDKLPLEIDPGMAFGTGQHETTRLCLEAMEKIFGMWQPATLSKRRILDVGTGSGILAIGAKKLGASTVVGTDIEEDAITAAKANARENNVELLLHHASLPQDGGYDLVIANILGVILLKMPQLLVKMLGDKGSFLLLSGLLNEEVDDIVRVYEAYGLRCEAVTQRGDWAAVMLKKA